MAACAGSEYEAECEEPVDDPCQAEEIEDHFEVAELEAIGGFLVTGDTLHYVMHNPKTNTNHVQESITSCLSISKGKGSRKGKYPVRPSPLFVEDCRANPQ